MSYANGTQFYNLPQTVGTDKRDWFDTNQAFANVDAALHTAVTGQAADAEAISTINAKLLDDEADIAALQTTTGTHTTQIATLQTTVNTQASQIADVRQDSEDMVCAYNEGAAETSTHAYEIGDYFIYNDVLYKTTAAIAIGDTIVPNTNCTATNATTEIAQLNSELFKGEVSVVGDGVKTSSILLDELYALIDITKISEKSMLVYGDLKARISFKSNSQIDFGLVQPSSNSIVNRAYSLKASGSTNYISGINSNNEATFTDNSNQIAGNGAVLKVVY